MSQDDLGGPEIGKYMLQGFFCVCQNDTEWKWSKKRQHLVSKIMVFAFRPKRTKRLLGHFSLGQNLGNSWSKSIVLENKVVLHFDFNQVIWVTRSGFFFLAVCHTQGHNLNVFGHFQTPYTPKDWFLSKKGPKEDERVARGHFHEYNGYLQALDLPQYLLPFPETGHFKIPWGATQFLFSKFYGLLKLIFHTNQYNAWYIVLYAEKAWNKRMIINFDIWSAWLWITR